MWLKQWDSSVYGSEIKSTEDHVLSALRRHSSVKRPKYSASKTFGTNRESMFSKDGANNYPFEENGNSKDIKDLGDKKGRQSGPPEQKVSYLICLEKHLFEGVHHLLPFSCIHLCPIQI